ncbi:MAG: hypothetical protein ACLFQW_06690 [Spirochaetaceae bacterium]
MNKTTAATIESAIKECDSHISKCKRARALLEQTVNTLNVLNEEFPSFEEMYMQVREYWISLK